jgi:hypothetical protein
MGGGVVADLFAAWLISWSLTARVDSGSSTLPEALAAAT